MEQSHLERAGVWKNRRLASWERWPLWAEGSDQCGARLCVFEAVTAAHQCCGVAPSLTAGEAPLGRGHGLQRHRPMIRLVFADAGAEAAIRQLPMCLCRAATCTSSPRMTNASVVRMDWGNE